MNSYPAPVRSRIAAATVFIVTAMLAACGGGGGSENNTTDNPSAGSSYTGVTAAATLGAANTPTIAAALLYELGLSNSGSLPSATAAGSGSLHTAAVRATKVQQSKRSWFAKTVTTENCPGGGTLHTDDNTIANGTGTITLTYTACIGESGVRIDGILSMQIAAYDLARDQPTDFTVTYQEYTQRAGSYGVDVDGTVRVVLDGSTSTTTFDVVARYQPEGIQHRMQNLVAQLQPLTANTAQLTVQGRFFHSALGYVDVDTTVPLTVDAFNGLASQGTLRLHNSAAAVADLRFTATNQFVLALDENADGTAERALSANGLAGLTTTNHLPAVDAGPDLIANEGQTVTLQGTASDWDGDALTYEWWCESAPGGGGFLIGAGPNTNFRPMQSGTYLIHLRVHDGQPSSSFDYITLTVRGNAAPSARAGNDVATVERATVTLDASASTDAEGDELRYTWTLRAQPVAGAAPASSQGRTFSFVPTIPGNYTYRLTVSDALGFSYDDVNISVGRLISFAFSSAVTIDPTTTPALITRTVPINMSSHYSGPPVALSVSTNVPWLDIVSAPAQTGSNTTVTVTVDTAELASMDSGNYVGTLTVSPTGYTSRSNELLMMLSLPQVERIAPYVTYTGRPTPVTLYGTHLHQTLGATLVVNGTQVQGFSEAMAEHARIVLPPLAAGEYDLRINNNLGVVQPMGRLVVRDAPAYPDGEFAISGRVESLEYDMERDAFYVISWDLDYGHQLEAYRLHFDGVQWQRDTLPVTDPLAVALDGDGTTLFVTTKKCGVQELDPDTLQVRQVTTKPSCHYELFGMVAGLANGRTVIADTNQWPTVFDYPSLSTSTIQFPSVHTPVHVLNRSHERLLWAESPTISPPQELYSYDVRTNSFTQISVHDPEKYFLAPLLALSGDGRRFMHRADVYEDAQYIGSLQGIASSLLCPALTSAGDRAVVLNPDTNIVSLFDLSSGPSFPKITDVATLPAEVGSGHVVVLPDDNVAFVFTTTFPPSGGNEFRMYVRNLP